MPALLEFYHGFWLTGRAKNFEETGMKLSVVFFLVLWAAATQAQYFSEQADPKLPSPQQTLGYAVGDWHVRHDQIQRYFEILANQSDNAMLEVIGYSHEQRPLLQLVISSPENLARLDDIRLQHQQHPLLVAVSRVGPHQLLQRRELGCPLGQRLPPLRLVEVDPRGR